MTTPQGNSVHRRQIKVVVCGHYDRATTCDPVHQQSLESSHTVGINGGKYLIQNPQGFICNQ